VVLAMPPAGILKDGTGPVTANNNRRKSLGPVTLSKERSVDFGRVSVERRCR